MKHLFLGFLLTCAFFSSAAQPTRSIPYPEVTGRNNNFLLIDKIDLFPDKTVVDILLQAPSYPAFRLSSNIYLQDQHSPRRYTLIATEGYPLGKQVEPGQTERVRLIFEPLVAGTQRVHLMEGCRSGDLSIQGIRIEQSGPGYRKPLPARIDFPETSGRNNDVLNVDRIELTPDATVLSVTATGEPGSSIDFSGRVYLQDNYSTRRYKLLRVETRSSSDARLLLLPTGWETCRLVFEPLQPGTRTVDLIGGLDPYAPCIWGLHITEPGSLQNQPEVATLLKPTETGRDQNTLYLSRLELRQDKTVLRLRAFGKGNFIQISSQSYLQDNFSGNRYRLKNLETIPVDRPFRISRDGFEFCLIFEPIKKGTRTVDLILGSGREAMHIWGIGINEEHGDYVSPPRIWKKEAPQNPSYWPVRK